MAKLILLATTDIHGSVLAHSYVDNSTQGFGLARFSSAVKEYAQHSEVLVVDNGDSLQGTPFLSYANNLKEGKHVLSQVMNQIGYDFVNLGNHDFNFGPSVLNRYLSDLDAPCLTSNIAFQGKSLGESKLVTTKSGKIIAFIGVCTDYIPHWEKPAHIKGMKFSDPIARVKAEISRLKPLADAVVVMYHGGLERDPISGVPTERLTGENVGYQLAQLAGIDLLITGHQHRSFTAQIGSTQVIQTTYNALEFAQITFEFGETLSVQTKIIKMAAFAPDPVIDEIGQSIETQTQIGLDVALGHVDGPSLKITDSFDARLHKHPLVSFINQVQLEVSGAQLSACALFNGVKGFNPDITYRDIVSTYIYPNTLVVKKMDKHVLKEFLEKCAEYFSVKDNKIIVSPHFDDPKPQHFNYDMVDGIDYTIKVSNPIGQRIVKMEYAGKPILDDAVFTIVMNNYRAVGGGDFLMVPPCVTVAEINRDMSELLAEALKRHPLFHLIHVENIHVIH